jgi:Iap family predicted aminopeptidase
MWKHHIIYESRPCNVIVTLGHRLYNVPEVVPTTSIPLISVKECHKVISKTSKFVFFMIQSKGEWKVTMTTHSLSPRPFYTIEVG